MDLVKGLEVEFKHIVMYVGKEVDVKAEYLEN